MKYEDFKARRVQFLPPLPLKQKAIQYSKGNLSNFMEDALREKIARIEADGKAANSVTRHLG